MAAWNLGLLLLAFTILFTTLHPFSPLEILIVVLCTHNFLPVGLEIQMRLISFLGAIASTLPDILAKDILLSGLLGSTISAVGATQW